MTLTAVGTQREIDSFRRIGGDLVFFGTKVECRVAEPERWRAQPGCLYWYVGETFEPRPAQDEQGKADNERFDAGNYFGSYLDAKRIADKARALLRDT